MAKTANVMTRVDPQIKEQAEQLLGQMGLSMASAIDIYLRQIIVERKIPFEIKARPARRPIALQSLNEEEFDTLMQESLDDYNAGRGRAFDDFVKEFDV